MSFGDYALLIGGAGTISMLFMQLVKWVVRKIMKNPTYAFQPVVYAIGIPVLNVFTPFLLFWLGVSIQSPVLALSVVDLVKYAVVVALGSLVSFLGYNQGVKPLTDYSDSLKASTPPTTPVA
jgi:hypothetical protein